MNLKEKYLTSMFNDTYKKCYQEGTPTDDRRVFINRIDNLMKASREIENVKSSFIRVAFNDRFENMVIDLKGLEQSLYRRGLIE